MYVFSLSLGFLERKHDLGISALMHHSLSKPVGTTALYCFLVLFISRYVPLLTFTLLAKLVLKGAALQIKQKC